MAGEETPAHQEERKELMSQQTRTLLVGVGIAIILLTVTAFAGSVRTENARRESLAAGVSALAASMKYPLLESHSLRTDAGKERLGPIVDELKAAGDFESVSMCEPDGTTIATTLGRPGDLQFERDELPSGKVKIESARNGLRLYAPIKVGDTILGYLVVETKD